MKGEAGRLDIQTTSDYFADLVEADTEETEGHSNLEKMMWIVSIDIGPNDVDCQARPFVRI